MRHIPIQHNDKEYIRCCICGRFIKLSDQDFKIEHTPDSPFSVEKTEYMHNECYRIWNNLYPH